MKLLKTTIRTLSRFHLYTVVNILGLAISLACVILIARYLYQETTVNHFAADLSRTYMISREHQNGESIYLGAQNPRRESGYRDPLVHDDIEYYSVFIPYGDDFIFMDENRYNGKLIVADTNFLKILPYPLLYGNVFSGAPDEIILTRHFSEKLFGQKNPIGETVTFSTGHLLRVVGVVGEPASKSFLNFDMLVNIGLTEMWSRMPQNLVMLRPGEDANRINEANSNFMALEYHDNLPIRYQLVPLKEFYFDRTRTLYQVYDPIFVLGNSDSVKVLSIVALLILFVGLFNFINIYTVVVLKRAREFGVKKIYGVGRRRIALQILAENCMMVLVALLFAWVLIEIAEAVLVDKLGFVVLPNLTFDVWLSIATLLLLPCIASLYPFLRYTYSAPVITLRSVNVGGVSVVSRKLFLFLQYVISFGLLVISFFFMKQLHYMLDQDPGYKTENVMMFTMMVDNHYFHSGNADPDDERKKQIEDVELIKRKINESPLFTEWVFGDPVYDMRARLRVKKSDTEESREVAYASLAPKYIEMFGFQLLEGRMWDDTDVFTQYKCIINESAKKLLDITDIHTAQLQFEHRLWYSFDVDHNVNPPYEIVGVIKDFNTGHLSKATVPLVIAFEGWEDPRALLMARFVTGKEKEAAAYLGEIYKEINNNAEFTYTLLEEDIARLYEEDKRISNVYIVFALLAMVISCMGLFAISLFDIRQRYREIALRKVNGATTKDITRLLLKKYIWLLVGAFAVAVPVVFLVINNYLKDFAYKASISWWLFAISLVIISGISLLTLMWQINNAVKVNPVKSLKAD